MPKIKELTIATEITPETVFVGAVDETSEGTKQYPFALMRDVIANTGDTYQALIRRKPIIINTDDTVLHAIQINGDLTITQILLADLETVDNNISITLNPELTVLDLGSLSNLGGQICVDGSPLLTSIALPDAITINNPAIQQMFTNCALDQITIDKILLIFDQSDSTGGSLTIDGGTNAIPSPAGLASKASLEAKGWTVIHN